ncbi:MAG: GyrI-like domain-containing protein [Anaerolineae bacterium]|nr:GyrI-like domain-containing protein [Anaerolineae bacterium]
MPKMDYKKDLKHLYLPSARDFTIVDVPPMNFLMADGSGDPNTSADFQEVVNALYGLAYRLKFALKAQGVEYTVPPLEGLWWSPAGSDITSTDKSAWHWTLMIMQPPPVTAEGVDKARAELARKRNPPALPRVRFEAYHEGLSVQILYIGAYADEGPTIARMHEFIRANGYVGHGKHHEIYLGDPGRTAPDKLKTVIRQPIRKP